MASISEILTLVHRDPDRGRRDATDGGMAAFRTADLNVLHWLEKIRWRSTVLVLVGTHMRAHPLEAEQDE